MQDAEHFEWFFDRYGINQNNSRENDIDRYKKYLIYLATTDTEGKVTTPPKMKFEPPVKFKRKRNLGFTPIPTLEKEDVNRGDLLDIHPYVRKIKQSIKNDFRANKVRFAISDENVEEEVTDFLKSKGFFMWYDGLIKRDGNCSYEAFVPTASDKTSVTIDTTCTVLKQFKSEQRKNRFFEKKRESIERSTDGECLLFQRPVISESGLIESKAIISCEKTLDGVLSNPEKAKSKVWSGVKSSMRSANRSKFKLKYP